MQAVQPTKADDLAAFENFFSDLSIATNIKPLTLSQHKSNIAQLVEGLLHIIEKGVCHGDLKPGNNFRSDRRFDIGDFGGAFIIADLVKKMNRAYLFNSDVERSAMNKFLNIFCDTNADSAKVEAACARYAAQVQQLKGWGIVTQKKGKSIPVVAMLKGGKLKELQAYLKIKCFPDMSKGYGYNPYMNFLCDYFWRCDAENYTRACNAFDIRAAGVTIFVNCTSELTPTDDAKAEYYDKLEASLRALQEEKIEDNKVSIVRISEKAISIIRRMAEPMQNVDTSPGKEFPLPVSIAELRELKAEMLK